MMAFCRTGFLNFDFFSGPYRSEGQNASAVQISSKSVKQFLRYLDFLYFQNGCQLPSGIFKYIAFIG